MIGTRYRPDAAVPDRLRVRVDPALPAASWLAVVVGGDARVVCGPSVERIPLGVVEGVWDAPFAEFGFDHAEACFGSGIRLRDGELRFVAPTHTLESLYLHEAADRLVVSNSLAFLLTHEGLDPRPDDAIRPTLASVAYGTRDHLQVVLTRPSGQVARVVDAVLVLRHDGLQRRPRSSERRFPDYAAYRDHLTATLARVGENAADAGRLRPLDWLATVSSGYDSSACAALAATAGCREAVTLARSRFGRPDSGEAIGRRLGLRVTVYDRDAAVRDAGIERMAEFVASGHGGEDLPFAAFEPLLAGRVVVTGWAGTLWDRNGEANDELKKKDLSGTALGEYRMRVGFAHLPLVCVGAASGHDVMAITQSPEMRPFALGNDYDKPIARRILEEAGVAREAFGQTKEAVSVLGFTDLRAWPSAARAAFSAYARAHAPAGAQLRQAAWALRSFMWRASRKLAQRLGWRLPRVWERRFLGTDWMIFEHTAPVTSELAFRWALEVVAPRYAGVRADRPAEVASCAGDEPPPAS